MVFLDLGECHALKLNGYHHVTAISADIAANYRFFTQVMGMRLVKRSVNQDQTDCWHLFYGDGAGSAGSSLTFFDWPATRGAAGSGVISAAGLRVPAGSLDFWQDRLAADGGGTALRIERAGREVLDYRKTGGLHLHLVAEDVPVAAAWTDSPVPPQHQVSGLAHQTITIHDRQRTHAMLTDVLHMDYRGAFPAPEGAGAPVHVYCMNDGGSACELHVIERPDLPVAELGGGSVHHMAFRTADSASLGAWAAHLSGFGFRVSDRIDRHYFRSIYFREPAGVLFEIATDGPGYAVDEPVQTLGQRMSLPPHLEPQRAAIEASLRPLG